METLAARECGQGPRGREILQLVAFQQSRSSSSSRRFPPVLNDDVEIIQPEWLDALLEHAQRREVGAVGAQLLYPDRSVQHAGIFLASMAKGRHAFRFARSDDPGYFGLALTQRNVIAVTGACLMTRRETFEAVGVSRKHTL